MLNGLTRAELRCSGPTCMPDGLRGGPRDSEYLRIAGIDEYTSARPDDVIAATMKRGDVLLFDQYTYHRSLPNISPNLTRWSIDLRFQDARVPTLRSEKGFVLGSDLTATGWGYITGSQIGTPFAPPTVYIGIHGDALYIPQSFTSTKNRVHCIIDPEGLPPPNK